MYKLHLILKYLRKRRIAWVSLIAVMMCTAMVIVVISVMGGWLRMFKETFHDITGDIVISRRSLTGFANYEVMIEKIKALPEVAGAAPTLKTYGLIDINRRMRDGVQVIGLPLEQMQNVNGFRHSLYRQYGQYIEATDDPKTTAEDREQLKQLAERPASFAKPYSNEEYQAANPELKGNLNNFAGMIVGAGVVGIGKDAKGKIEHWPALFTAYARLTVMPLAEQGATLDPMTKSDRYFFIVDDSRTKVWQYDSNTVYVPFDLLQKDLGMDKKSYTDSEGNKINEPARTSEIHIGLKLGANLWATRDKIQQIVDGAIGSDQATQLGIDPVVVQTWEQFNAKFISAVEHEKVLVTFLFSLISIVAIFLIFCIFYMIVVEKTRDIGIIKSVGATASGVAGIFLGYGLAIGIVGSGLGLLAGYLIIHNINFLHEKMGELMGIQIWNPEVYAFDIIPNTINPREVAVIMAVAVVSSVLGAFVPAVRAARLHPVEALRFE
ncbi:MAG TPA: FtsX-like permease family protein [Tepidisphaeraceae bacterium]|nr:FtsX-like permease family protein [Tepidisphaeraceae bacterium]